MPELTDEMLAHFAKPPPKKKVFREATKQRKREHGSGTCVPMSWREKQRLIAWAEVLDLEGLITPVTVKILKTLLNMHSRRYGLCIPSHATIAKHVGCCSKSVQRGIVQLEEAGIITWDNRLISEWRMVGGQKMYLPRKTSNSYRFIAAPATFDFLPPSGQFAHLKRKQSNHRSKKAQPPCQSAPTDLMGMLLKGRDDIRRAGHSTAAIDDRIYQLGGGFSLFT